MDADSLAGKRGGWVDNVELVGARVIAVGGV